MRRKVSTEFLALHCIARMLIVRHGFEEGYKRVAIALFPYYRSALQSGLSNADCGRFVEIADHMVKEVGIGFASATCVSVSTTIQACLFVNGIDAEMIVGVEKVDSTMLSHAWVRLPGGNMVINPGKVRGKFVEIYKRSMRSVALNWLMEEGLDSYSNCQGTQ